MGTVHKAKGLEFDTVHVLDDFVKVPCARHNLAQLPHFRVGEEPVRGGGVGRGKGGPGTSSGWPAFCCMGSGQDPSRRKTALVLWFFIVVLCFLKSLSLAHPPGLLAGWLCPWPACSAYTSSQLWDFHHRIPDAQPHLSFNIHR